MERIEDCMMAVTIVEEDGNRFCPILATESGTCEDCYRYFEEGLIYREEDP